MGALGKSDSNTIMTLIHYTQPENIDNIIKNDFDFNKSGEGAGTVWGDGAYYLKQGSYEDDRYSSLLDTESYIKSNIDTSGMLHINTLRNSEYRSSTKMYDDAAKSFSKILHRDYTRLKKQYGAKQAFTSIAKDYYSGLVINHNIGKGVDSTSGGSQVVVYNKSSIKTKKAYK